MKKILCIFLFFISLFSINAQDAYRRTAIRYLQLSKDSLSDFSWTNAYELADIGIAYDTSLSDLWYVQALAYISLGKKPFEIIPLVQTSLSNGNWIDYNSNAARVLLASLYVEIGEYSDALSLVDERPILMTQEAERIRAEAYYGLGDFDNARKIISVAINTYPNGTGWTSVFTNAD